LFSCVKSLRCRIGTPITTFSVRRSAINKIMILNMNGRASYDGGIIGQIDAATATLSDIDIQAVITSAGERVGGVFGEVKKSSSAIVERDFAINRAVLRVNLNGTRYVGGIEWKRKDNFQSLDQCRRQKWSLFPNQGIHDL